ncbi:MAG: ribose-5-phosphate isomerase A, partial [Deltaproteobacteria bacterium]|nr:ribose-5-phosphate isomerase A [Deltaproteobacteria bacterium]
IEVIPFALAVEMHFLQGLGAKPILRGERDQDPFITDEGNLILDANFGPIEDVQRLADQLNQRAGIVEHGLFLGMAAEVIVAEKGGIRQLTAETL